MIGRRTSVRAGSGKGPRRLRPLHALRADEQGLALTEFAFVAATMIFMYLGTTQLTDAIAANRRVTITARALADLASRTPTDTGSLIGVLKESQAGVILVSSEQVLYPYDPANAQFRVSEVWKCAVPANRSTRPAYDPESASFNLTNCLAPFDTDPARASDPTNIADQAIAPVVGVQWSCVRGTGIQPLGNGSSTPLPSSMGSCMKQPTANPSTLQLPSQIKAGTVMIYAEIKYTHKPWFAGFNFGTMHLSDAIYMVPRSSTTIQLLSD